MTTEETVSICMETLDDYVDQVLRERGEEGESPPHKTGLLPELWRLIRVHNGSDESARVRYYEAVRKKREYLVSEANAKQLLATIHGVEMADYQKRIRCWRSQPSETVQLPTGNANMGEIEVSAWSSENLIGNSHSPVDRFISVHVDDVRFRQRDHATQTTRVSSGRYIRIGNPSGSPGAVVLAVDERGRVLLVRQYRHPVRQWLTEAPRGFGSLDETPDLTAKRELLEEAGARPRKLATGEMLFSLRALHTDTGVMTTQVVYFLALVDSKLATDRLLRRGPVMENLVWIHGLRFYESLHLEEGVGLSEAELEFVFDKGERDRLFARTELDDGVLRIVDAFTVTAAYLALPLLKRYLKELFGAVG